MRKLTTAEWIEKAKTVHGDRYSYITANYTTAKNLVSIICSAHGVFTQTAQHHTSGHGCPKCANNHNYTNEEFIVEANMLHEHKYTYKNCVYSSSKSKVLITCAAHGDFMMTPNNHLQGKGCPICNKINTQDFIEKAKLVHGDRYDYSKVDYKKHNSKVTILCSEHGEFEKTPSNHLKGGNCPKCSKSGFDPDKKAILYYLKITVDDELTLYKIGITNRTVQERFNLTELSKIEIIKQKLYEIGQDAYDEEQRVLKQFKEFKYTGPAILETGNTELFTVDVFG